MINLSDVILNPDYAQSFIVFRSSGDWINGRWTEGTPAQITMSGVVSVANENEVKILPEGDRIQGAMVFHSVLPIYTTRLGSEKGTSDKIMWNGEYYKLLNVWNYKDYGFYKAIGVRIIGS